MTSFATNPHGVLRCNWLRVGGISASMTIHVAALLLLAIPVALPTARQTLPELSIRWIEIPVQPEILPVPDEPQPRHLPRVALTPVAKPVTRPDVAVDSVMALAIPTLNDPLLNAAEPGAESIAAPAAGSSVALDYASTIKPRYPLDSIRRGEQGTVLLRVFVGSDGLPTEIEIARSSGFRQLDRAAREAVMGWRFRPVQVNGTAVPASGLVPVEFSLGRG